MKKLNLITFSIIIMIFFQYQIMKSQTDTSKNHPLNFAFNINLAVFLSESSVDDWKTGAVHSLEFSNSSEFISIISYSNFYTNIKIKALSGVRYEYIEDKNFKDIIPTDNSITSEGTLKYKLGWKIDPFFTTTTNTQITESFKRQINTKIRTAKTRDPITLQHTLGFTYNIFKKKNQYIDACIGLSLKQIRAEKYTLLTDDRTTRNIIERYKIENGIQIKVEANYKFAENIDYRGKLDLTTKYEDLEKWITNWENEFQIRIWKIFGISLKMDFYYNEQIKPKLFYKQNLKLGLITNF